MKFEAAAISDMGPRRINEDQVAYWSPELGTLVAAIADGLGGMGGGSDASKIAISTLRQNLNTIPMDIPQLEAAAEEAHRNILAAQKSSPELRSMATTLSVGVFSPNRLFGIHCGDTRVSIARAKGVLRLTKDQSEGERLYQAGKLTKDELWNYPRKNVLDSALGVHEHLQLDIFEFDLVPGDKVFFTTDGVHGKIYLREIREIAAVHKHPENFVKEISSVVRTRSPDDNFSVLAVFAYP